MTSVHDICQQDCAVYRLYNAADELEYVGISIRPFERLLEHRGNKGWWKVIKRIDLQHFDSVENALAEESEAIKNENPKRNIADSPDLKRDHDRAVRLSSAPKGRSWSYAAIDAPVWISQKNAAEIIGFTSETLRSWSNTGIAPSFRRFPNRRIAYDANEIQAFKQALDDGVVFG